MADLELASNNCAAELLSVSPEPMPLHMCSSMYVMRAGSTSTNIDCTKHMAEESASPQPVTREGWVMSRQDDAHKAQADEEPCQQRGLVPHSRFYCLKQACASLAGDLCFQSTGNQALYNPPVTCHQGFSRQAGAYALHLPAAFHSPSTSDGPTAASRSVSPGRGTPFLLTDWHSCRRAGGESPKPAQPTFSRTPPTRFSGAATAAICLAASASCQSHLR